MINIQFITSQNCSECIQAKQILKEAKNFFPKLRVQEYDVMGVNGLEIAVKYGMMAIPGIIINDELFSVGNLDREKFYEKINSLIHQSKQ